jgi:hypothetical protein
VRFNRGNRKTVETTFGQEVTLDSSQSDPLAEYSVVNVLSPNTEPSAYLVPNFSIYTAIVNEGIPSARACMQLSNRITSS